MHRHAEYHHHAKDLIFTPLSVIGVMMRTGSMCVTLAMPVCTRILDNRSDFFFGNKHTSDWKELHLQQEASQTKQLVPHIVLHKWRQKKRVVDNSTEKPTVVEWYCHLFLVFAEFQALEMNLMTIKDGRKLLAIRFRPQREGTEGQGKHLASTSCRESRKGVVRQPQAWNETVWKRLCQGNQKIKEQ